MVRKDRKKAQINKLGHQGFSIVEILVALMLVVLVFTLIPTNTRDEERDKLNTVIEDFRRAARFATNEAVLRNAITRITIDMETEPQEYYVEYSTEGGLALPQVENPEGLSFSEREEQAKKIKDLDSQFQKVSEFADENKQMPFGVRALGLANVNIEDILISGKLHIYFYPTGEKDGALIFLSSESELATLDIPPFENTTFTEYSIYSEYDLRNIDTAQLNKMKELRDQWLKN